MFKRVNIQFTLNAPAVITEYPYNVIIILVFACGARIYKSAIYLFSLRRCVYGGVVWCGMMIWYAYMQWTKISNIVSPTGWKEIEYEKQPKLGNKTSSISNALALVSVTDSHFSNVGAVCCLLLFSCCCCCGYFLRNRSQFPFEFRLVHCVVCNGIDGSTSMKFMSHEIHLARIRCVIQIPKPKRNINDVEGIYICMIFNWILFWWYFWYIVV